MAPALSIAPREPHILDTNIVQENEKPLSHRRRALASVDNLAAHMEEDDMGLQNQPNLAKDSQEMEQILVDFENSDLAQGDLFQVIKTLESGGDTLSGDPEAIFPLSGFDLTDTADSEGDVVEDKVKAAQLRLERRCAFLKRRLRILQARHIGKRVSDEVAITFEKCCRGARRDGGGRPIGLKTFMKTVETTSAIQANSTNRTTAGPSYYNPGTSRSEPTKSSSIGVPAGTLAGLSETAGALRTHLSLVKHELDSDATASSSGAESNDEAIPYTNPHQQTMQIERRALWTWQRNRSAIGYRWCWLQAQVQELEYKIRQHTELHLQVREAKGPVEFEGEPAAYIGSLPGAEAPEHELDTERCARIRPLRRETFKKRKLLQMHNLHIATSKAAKPSEVKCSCSHPLESCSVCTGRAEPTQPAPPFSTQARPQRRAHVDASYHPVLSDIKELCSGLHMSALSGRGWFRPRFMKAWRGAHHAPAPPAPAAARHAAPAAAATPRPARRHPSRLKRGRPPLSRRNRDRERDEETGQERTRNRSSTESRSWRRQSYDIDNIVIPQSVAANTRPQILTYKEIITPKWRVMEIPETSMNNGVMKSMRMSIESEEEDVSDAAVQLRHARAEGRERERYVRKRRRRDAAHAVHDDHADHDHHALTYVPPPAPPPPLAPPREPSPPPPPTVDDEAVRPYTPRTFPLPDELYQDMLAAMPAGYRPTSPTSPTSPTGLVSPGSGVEPASPVPAPPDLDDASSSLSPLSPPGAYDGDDPDDAEWDPLAERADRRKNSFR